MKLKRKLKLSSYNEGWVNEKDGKQLSKQQRTSVKKAFQCLWMNPSSIILFLFPSYHAKSHEKSFRRLHNFRMARRKIRMPVVPHPLGRVSTTPANPHGSVNNWMRIPLLQRQYSRPSLDFYLVSKVPLTYPPWSVTSHQPPLMFILKTIKKRNWTAINPTTWTIQEGFNIMSINTLVQPSWTMAFMKN